MRTDFPSLLEHTVVGFFTRAALDQSSAPLLWLRTVDWTAACAAVPNPLDEIRKPTGTHA